MTEQQLRAEIQMAMDGVVVVIPPKKQSARENFCKAEVTHCWRKKSEQNLPELTGRDKYNKQAPASRCVPLWGGIGPDGFSAILWHDARKVDSQEWATAV